MIDEKSNPAPPQAPNRAPEWTLKARICDAVARLEDHGHLRAVAFFLGLGAAVLGSSLAEEVGPGLEGAEDRLVGGLDREGEARD